MVKPVPDGFHTVTPFLSLKGLSDFLPFLEKAFAATVVERMDGPGGVVMHAEVQIGNSMLMMGDPGEESPGMPGMLYLYVDDCDAWFKRAVQAGAEVLRPVEDQFYGDRSGGLKDGFGNVWWIATHKEDLSPEELRTRAAAAGRG